MIAMARAYLFSLLTLFLRYRARRRRLLIALFSKLSFVLPRNVYLCSIIEMVEKMKKDANKRSSERKRTERREAEGIGVATIASNWRSQDESAG